MCLCGGLVRVMLNGSTVHQDENMFKSAKGRVDVSASNMKKIALPPDHTD